MSEWVKILFQNVRAMCRCKSACCVFNSDVDMLTRQNTITENNNKTYGTLNEEPIE